MSTAIKVGLWSMAIVLAILLFLSGAYFLHGSLEQFPMDEQLGKVSIASGFSFILFAFLEVFVLIKLLGKGSLKSGVVVSQQLVQNKTSPPSDKMRN